MDGDEMTTTRDECKQQATGKNGHWDVEVIHFMLPLFLDPIRSIVIIIIRCLVDNGKPSVRVGCPEEYPALSNSFPLSDTPLKQSITIL
jgi:hypothetical protein